jgi:hypothetical protein
LRRFTQKFRRYPVPFIREGREDQLGMYRKYRYDKELSTEFQVPTSTAASTDPEEQAAEQCTPICSRRRTQAAQLQTM